MKGKTKLTSMKKNIFYVLLVIIGATFSCNKDTFPEKEVPNLDFSAITFQPTDQKRLCLADLIAKSFVNDVLRSRIKVLSASDVADKHKEIWLWEFLNDPIFKNALEVALKSGKSRCYTTFEEFKNDLLADPALVLKIPDIIDLNEWDAAQQEPFLYVRTNYYIRKNPLADTAAMIGFHSSGLTDYYFNGLPTYLPIILKSSEDHLLVNQEGTLCNGVKFSTLHDVSASRFTNLDLGQRTVQYKGRTYFFVPFNEVIHQINLSDGSFVSSFLTHPCSEPCVFACTPESDRRLAFDHILIDNQNPKALEYTYKSSFRPGGHWILYDNIVPAIYYREIRSPNQIWPQYKRILGSFRINDFFAMQRTTVLLPETYQVNSKDVTLYRLAGTCTVNDLKKIASEPILLTDSIPENGRLQVSMVRLYFDQVSQSFPIYSGDQISTNKYYSDGVFIYHSYCIPVDNNLGFNSVALQLRY